MSCHRRLIVAVLASAGWLSPTRAADQEKPPKEIDAAAVEAWKKKGFTAGFMGLDANGDLAFAAHADELTGAVPAFRIESARAADLRGLPRPKVPFGLWIMSNLGFRPSGDLPPGPGAVEVLAGLEHLTHLKLSGPLFNNASLEDVTELESLTHLDLSRTWMSGPALKHLAGLKKLTHLNLRDTAVPSHWLKYLSGLKSLTELAVEGVTDGDLKHVAALKGLTRLSIRHASYRFLDLTGEGLKPLAGHLGLTRLELDARGITPDGWRQLRAIPGLTSLTVRSLNGTPDDWKHIGELRGLTSLTTTGPARAEDLKHLAALLNLTRLELPDAPVTDEVMKHLAGLPKLTSLRMGSESAHRQVTADGLKRLAEFKSLTDLSLGRGVGDEHLRQLAGLSNLTRLELHSYSMRGDGLTHLAALTGLARLELRLHSETPAVKEAVENLRKALPKCKVVVHGEPAR